MNVEDEKTLNETISALEKTRVFVGKVAGSVEKRHGKQNAQKLVEAAHALDELLRATRETRLMNSVIPQLEPILDLTKTPISKTLH